MEPPEGKGTWKETKEQKQPDKLIEAEKAETGNVTLWFFLYSILFNMEYMCITNK